MACSANTRQCLTEALNSGTPRVGFEARTGDAFETLHETGIFTYIGVVSGVYKYAIHELELLSMFGKLKIAVSHRKMLYTNTRVMLFLQFW